MRILFLTLLAIVSLSDLQSQILKGSIKDAEGEPVQYATVYIQELKQGTTTNTKGDYELRLPDGKYTVIYQSLGYEPEIKNINVVKNTITINVVLQVQYYEIPEVRISASGEDPAYSIMRKVIGMAPYYLNHVSHYKADVYLKGNLVMIKIPKIIQRQMKVEAKSNSGSSVSSATIKEGETYMMESVNEIEFSAPDKYIHHVLSSRSTFPDQGTDISPMDFVQASFYEPVIQNMFISPLSPEAFHHYKFKYSGMSVQGNYIIDKVQVTPKRSSQQLFEGTIYIIEDLWCLHSVDLVNDNIAGKIRVQQLYIPVQEEVWMPVSLKFDVNISIIGVKADASYGSSIKYNEVTVNKTLQKPAGLTSGNSGNYAKQRSVPDTTNSKTQAEIDRLLKKNELTNRDMAKLSGLMEKKSKESLPDSVKNNLEVKDKTTYIIEKDANKRDSSYWAGIRPIPLSENEAKSIRLADSVKGELSLKKSPADTSKTSVKKKSTFFSVSKEIISGHTWSDTSGFRFTNGGLINLKSLQFNTVDGFVYGIDFRVSKTWKKKGTLTVMPDFRYAFSRARLMWRVNAQYSFNNDKPNLVFLRVGVSSRDLGSGGGINPFLNTISSLFFEKNYLKLYETRYLSGGYRIEITNGVNINLIGGYEDRRILSNTSDYSIIKTQAEYSDNIPDNRYLDEPVNPVYSLQDHKHAELSVSVNYTPRMKYTISNGRKLSRGSDWPTFSFGWKHGINQFADMEKNLYNFDQLRFEVFRRSSIGAMSEFRWRYRAGAFLNKSGANFIDFFHFNPQPIPVLLNDYEDAFMLPKYYSLSTPEYFSELHTKYTTPYLLLKLIPGLSKTLMRENLSLGFLWSHYQKAYTEIGYSISEILLVGEVGVYVGFDNFSYSSVGGKIVLRFN
jgi:hypothetical protein